MSATPWDPPNTEISSPITLAAPLLLHFHLLFLPSRAYHGKIPLDPILVDMGAACNMSRKKRSGSCDVVKFDNAVPTTSEGAEDEDGGGADRPVVVGITLRRRLCSSALDDLGIYHRKVDVFVFQQQRQQRRQN